MAGFSETFMDHFTSPRNSGPMEAPDSIGSIGTPGRGRYFMMAVKVGGGVVRQARFQTYGCGATIAAGSVLTEMVRERPISECMALTEADLIAALEGVPPNKLHGPALAIGALRDALKKLETEKPS